MNKLPPRFPDSRKGRRADPDLAKRRIAGAAMVGQQSHPDVAVENVVIGDVPCVQCIPANNRGTIIHAHGGGFRLGSAAAWTPFGTRLANACGMVVVLPDYALAPEHPFPAGLADIVNVHGAVTSRDHGAIFLSGDSAGGALAAAAAYIAEGSKQCPDGLILISPWLDLTNRTESFRSREGRDALFSLTAANEAADTYLQGWDAHDPIASPLFLPPEAMPPTLVQVSADEVLLDDSLAFTTAMAKSGRAVLLSVQPACPHVWPVIAPDHHASVRALDMIAAFVRTRWLVDPSPISDSTE